MHMQLLTELNKLTIDFKICFTAMDHSSGTTRQSTSMVQEDHEASSVEDILSDAVRDGHQILYLNYKCLAEFPMVLCSITDDGQSVYCHVERLYMKRNLLVSLVRHNALVRCYPGPKGLRQQLEQC